MPPLQIIAASVFGVIFLIVLIVIALAVPEPTTQQMFIFRVVLALAAAGVGAMIPGFLDINGKIWEISLRATGALALFVLIYRINPPGLAAKSALPKPKRPAKRKMPPHLIEEASAEKDGGVN